MEKLLVVRCGIFSTKYSGQLGQTTDPNRILGTRTLTKKEFAANVVACLTRLLESEGYNTQRPAQFITHEALRESERICSDIRDRFLGTLLALNWYASKNIRLHSTDGINIYIFYEE